MNNEPTNEQLAEWIEKGLATEGVQEATAPYLSMYGLPCKVCALGAMIIGKVGDIERAREAVCEMNFQTIEADIAKALGFSPVLARQIDDLHKSEKTAREIAAILRNGEIE